jgi:hypothetical protein
MGNTGDSVPPALAKMTAYRSRMGPGLTLAKAYTYDVIPLAVVEPNNVYVRATHLTPLLLYPLYLNRVHRGTLCVCVCVCPKGCNPISANVSGKAVLIVVSTGNEEDYCAYHNKVLTGQEAGSTICPLLPIQS